MSNILSVSGPIKVGSLAADPANPTNGLIYYNTTSNTFQQYKNGAFKAVIDEDTIAALTGTDVTFAKSDGTKKNIQAASDDLETAVDDLDEAIGTLNQGSNYTAGDATAVGSHLDAIDDALATAGGTEFADDVFKVKGSVDATKKVAIEADGITTATTRTITMPDTDVDLGDIAANTSKVTNVTTNLGYTTAASTGTVTSSDGTDATLPAATVSLAGLLTGADKTKLDAIETSATADQTGAEIKVAYEGELDTNAFTDAEQTKLGGVEALADVTDSINVDAAGAVMESDTSTASMSFVVDEDTMVSDSATKVPTQQSVKAFVEAEVATAVAGGAAYVDDYDAVTDTPSLDDGTPVAGISQGDMYSVSVAGTFFTKTVEIGDMLISKQASPTLEAHWSIVQANLTPVTIKTQYESNTDTNAFTDAQQTKVGHITVTQAVDLDTMESDIAGKASKDLSDLTATSVNVDLVPVDATKKLGGAAAADHWAEIHSDKLTLYTGATLGAILSTNGSGDLTVTGAKNVSLDTNAGGIVQTKGTITTDGRNNQDDIGTSASMYKDIYAGSLQSSSTDVVLAGQDSVKRAKQASKTDFIEEEYIHSTSLTGSQTNAVITDLTFAHATVEGCEITYKVKEATSNDIRIGTMRVVTNGTTVVLNDVSTETADTGITFDAVVNGANVNIRYSSGTNGATLRCDVKRIKA